MNATDIAQLAKECMNVAVISRGNPLDAHAQIVEMIQLAIAPLQQELTHFKQQVEQLNWKLSRNTDAGGGLSGLEKWIDALIKDKEAHCSELAELRKDRERLQLALNNILQYPVHSEPVGGAMAMKDIANDAMKGNP